MIHVQLDSPTAASTEDMKKDAVFGLVEEKEGVRKADASPSCITISDRSFILLHIIGGATCSFRSFQISEPGS